MLSLFPYFYCFAYMGTYITYEEKLGYSNPKENLRNASSLTEGKKINKIIITIFKKEEKCTNFPLPHIYTQIDAPPPQPRILYETLPVVPCKYEVYYELRCHT